MSRDCSDTSVHGKCIIEDVLSDRIDADTKDVGLVLPSPGAQRSIYDRYSSRRRMLMLLAISLTRLLPTFADTMYLPSLLHIQADLGGTDVQAAATMGVFLVAIGVSVLLWGPACDWLGRRPIYIMSSVGFAAASLGCAFTPSMWAMLLLRSLQGAFVGACTIMPSGVITDVYPPGTRGVPFGVATTFQLAGRTLGGLFGGFISQQFGWRSAFLAVAILAGAIILPCLLCCVPETHRFKYVRKLQDTEPLAAARLIETDDILSQPPRFKAPWAPLLCIVEKPAVLHVCVSAIALAAMYLCMMLISKTLPLAPYCLTSGMIGIVHLVSLGGFVAAPVGGFLFDKAIALHPTEAMAQLTYNTAAALLVLPLGMLLFGWSMSAKAHLAAVVVAVGLVNAGTYLYHTALFAYLSCTKPKAAATAAAGVMFVVYCTSGVIVVAGSAVARAIGVFNLFIALAALQLTVTFAAAWQIYCRCKPSVLQILPVKATHISPV